MKIAFFDSGIGGLTVFKEALRLFPNEDYIYFSDALYAPYGGRSKQEVERLIIEAVDFLAQQDIDVLVIACHTASILMTEKLSRRYHFPIIGMKSGIADLYPLNSFKKTLICGTDLSVHFWENRLQSHPINAEFLSLQKLVRFAENFEFDSSASFDYLYDKLTNINWTNYEAILLGCTHFPFFKRQIRTLIPEHIEILDGGQQTVQELQQFIPNPNFKGVNTIDYFISKKRQPARFFSKYFDVLEERAFELVHS